MSAREVAGCGFKAAFRPSDEPGRTEPMLVTRGTGSRGTGSRGIGSPGAEAPGAERPGAGGPRVGGPGADEQKNRSDT